MKVSNTYAIMRLYVMVVSIIWIRPVMGQPCEAWEVLKSSKGSTLTHCEECPPGKHQEDVNNPNKCVYCDAGEVRGADGRALTDCTPVTDIEPCQLWEYADKGQCKTCKNGEHHDSTAGWVACTACPTATVRGSDGGAANDCTHASLTCELYQKADRGKCKNCPSGQHHTGDDSDAAWINCVYCDAGEVRGDDGRALTDCTLATETGPCKLWEHANKGQCKKCKDGEHHDSTVGWVVCTACPTATVRGTDGREKADCSHASTTCELYQKADQGKCKDCPSGQHHTGNNSNANWINCDDCDDGTVRGADGREKVDCYAPTESRVGGPGPNPCELWEYAGEGQCQKCPNGEHHVLGTDWTDCEACPAGTWRGPVGSDDTDCVLVPGGLDPDSCEPWETVVFNKCVVCPRGRHRLDGTNICGFCPNGYVRGAGGRALTDCTPATNDGPPCELWEYAGEGRCTKCSVGEHHDSTVGWAACTTCPTARVRGANGRENVDCTRASTTCELYQMAEMGKCKVCPRGQHHTGNNSNANWITCDYCDAGEVRGNGGRALTDCTRATETGPCELWEYADEGRCKKCSVGEHHDSTVGWTTCTTCPPGFVRGANGRGDQDCVIAYSACESYEHAEAGKCSKCTRGSWIDTTTCVFCPPGFVRGETGRDEVECVPAELFCGTRGNNDGHCTQNRLRYA